MSAGITPVSIRLKNNVRMSISFDIIRRVERQLQNERIRAIENTTEISSWESDTCMSQSASVLDQDTFQEYYTFISRVREAKHRCVR